MKQKKKIAPQRFKRLWFIKTYNTKRFLWIFKRDLFYVYASSPAQAKAKLLFAWPEANVLFMSSELNIMSDSND